MDEWLESKSDDFLEDCLHEWFSNRRGIVAAGIKEQTLISKRNHNDYS